MTPLRALAFACAALPAWAALSGCQTTPPLDQVGKAPPPMATMLTNDPVRLFEQHERERAVLMENQGQWPEAAAAWEVLAVLDPPRYTERLQQVRKRMAEQAQETLKRAKEEMKNNNLAAAEEWYIATLALLPDQQESADALRAIEQARNRRELARPPRVARTAPAEAAASRNAPVVNKYDPGNSLDLEHAAALAGQGDVDEAIELMELRMRRSPRDDVSRGVLVDLLVRKAKGLVMGNSTAATAIVKRCLLLEPTHPGALALRNQLIAPKNNSR